MQRMILSFDCVCMDSRKGQNIQKYNIVEYDSWPLYESSTTVFWELRDGALNLFWSRATSKQWSRYPCSVLSKYILVYCALFESVLTTSIIYTYSDDNINTQNIYIQMTISIHTTYIFRWQEEMIYLLYIPGFTSLTMI